MKNNIRVSSEKSNSTYDIKAVFQKNFRKQIKNYITIVERENGKKPKESVVKKNLLQYLSDNYYSNYDSKSVSKWYTGENLPQPEVIVLIAKFFNCSTDELLMDKNPYEQLNQQMREKGFSEEATKIIELWLRKNPKTQKVLFGDNIQVNDWGTFDFLNDLICNKEIDKLIGCYRDISEEFFNLSNDDIEKINAKIPELEQSHILRNNKEVLESLLLELPKKIKYKVQNIKDDIDLFIEIQTAIYILKLYKNETKRRNIKY